MRLARLRGGELLAGSGGLLLAVAMFLPWFGKVSPYCVPLAGHSCGRDFDAWQKLSAVEVVLLLAAAVAGLVMAVLAARSPKTDAAVTSAAMTVPLGLLATLISLYRIAEPVGKLDPRYGLYLGLAGCLAVTYGSWRAIRNERPPARTRAAPPIRPRPASRRRSPSSSG